MVITVHMIVRYAHCTLFSSIFSFPFLVTSVGAGSGLVHYGYHTMGAGCHICT